MLAEFDRVWVEIDQKMCRNRPGWAAFDEIGADTDRVYVHFGLSAAQTDPS